MEASSHLPHCWTRYTNTAKKKPHAREMWVTGLFFFFLLLLLPSSTTARQASSPRSYCLSFFWAYVCTCECVVLFLVCCQEHENPVKRYPA